METRQIGSKLKILRNARRMTQKELGELLDYSESYISHIEKGNRNPSIKDLQKLTKIFNVSIDYFFDKVMPPTASTHFRADVKSASAGEDDDRVFKEFVQYAKKIINS